ncbi:MAG: thiamine pyrophosphate-binding protein, partial [Hyphomicrobiaceae bacterium]
TEVRRIEDLPRAIHRAAKEALSPPTGPVFLSLPVDVMNAAADIDLGHATRVAPGIRGDAKAVADAAEMLLAARNPVIVAGDAVSQGLALDEVVRLAELLGAYVYLEGVASTTNFPTTHPQYFGQVLRLSPLIRETLKPHDVMLSLGGDLFTQSLPTKVEPLPDGIKVIHLDTDPREIGKNFPATIGILGEPKATVPDLIAEIERRLDGPARTRLAARKKATEATAAERRPRLFAAAAAQAKLSPIRPLALLKTVADLLPKNAVVVEETLSSSERIREIIPSLDAKSFFGMRGGGIGWGLPAAIGVKLGQPNRPVVALIGDGSSMYTIQALWTAAHHRIGCIVFMILNNASYRILKQRMNAMRSYAAQTDTWPGMDLDDPPIDFVAIARAMGLKAGRAETLSQVGDRLKDALAGNEPVLIEVKLDKGFKPV